MTVKDFVIAVCFLGGVVLAAYGGWRYIWGRVDYGNETIKIEAMQKRGYTDYKPEALLKKLKQEKNKGLVMFAAGTAIIYFVIAYINRRRKYLQPIHYKN